MNLEIISESKKLMFTDKDKIIAYRLGIKILRKALNLNTQKFGEKVGVTGRTVETWEQGLREPSMSALMLMQKLILKGKFDEK